MATKEKQSKAEAAAQKKRDELILFCSRCFASEDGGSWTRGQAIVSGLCSNCGAGGPDLRIPRWAVDGIRESASWVGKRYYPNDEDIETSAEVRNLRATIKVFPGRTVEQTADGQAFMVTQELPGGRSVSMFTGAATAEKALEDLRLDLPYIPKSALKKPK